METATEVACYWSCYSTLFKHCVVAVVRKHVMRKDNYFAFVNNVFHTHSVLVIVSIRFYFTSYCFLFFCSALLWTESNEILISACVLCHQELHTLKTRKDHETSTPISGLWAFTLVFLSTVSILQQHMVSARNIYVDTMYVLYFTYSSLFSCCFVKKIIYFTQMYPKISKLVGLAGRKQKRPSKCKRNERNWMREVP